MCNGGRVYLDPPAADPLTLKVPHPHSLPIGVGLEATSVGYKRRYGVLGKYAGMSKSGADGL